MSVIDQQLQREPALGPRHTPASAFAPLVECLRGAERDDGSVVVEQDDELVRLLGSYRSRFAAQVVHDFGYNLQQLRQWAGQQQPNGRVCEDAQVQDGFERLESARRLFLENDQWSSRMETPCWLAFQQFYCDALALGDRLLRLQKGRHAPRRIAARLRRRQVLEGASAYRFAQALVNAVEKDLPNMFNLRPLHSLLPVGYYSGSRALLPVLRFHWPAFLGKLHYVLTCGAINSLVERSDSIIDMRGKAELLGNPQYYDPVTGNTRHNLIIVLSHRHSTIDLPIGAEALGDIDHAMWGNELYYPKSATKDSRMVTVGSMRRQSMAAVLDKSADLMMHARIPVAIVVDGGGAYLPYGQQMHLKRGIRVLVDHMNAVTQGSKRRTYIVPLSFDDPVSLIAGLDSRVRLTFHQPICTDDIAPAPSKPDRQAIHRGDPLLVYLEALFLANTGQVRHGWHTPKVVDTVRQFGRHPRSGSTIRRWLRGKFHASMFDLCRAQRS